MTDQRPPDTPYSRHTKELDAGAHMHAARLGAAARLIAAGALIGAVFGSDILFTWAFNLPLWLGPVREIAVEAVRGWHETMQALGITEVHATLRDWFREFQYLEWPRAAER
jgi:hypothetical protein